MIYKYYNEYPAYIISTSIVIVIIIVNLTDLSLVVVKRLN